MINFTVVRWKNLLSSGNTFTELALNEHQTTLVLGENGAGKSTLLDALCFGLYGRGFRNLKKELLINSVNEKALLVEVEFDIGKKHYKIIRGMKPNLFEIYVDDVFINQDATVRDYQEQLEKQILKMNYRSFTQVCILGSANFVPFMQLKSKDRRNLVEDLLDISIFSTMGDILRTRVQNHVIEVRETTHQINIMEERLNGLSQQLVVLQENRDEKIGKFEDTISETQTNIDSLFAKVTIKTDSVAELDKSINDRDPQGDRLKQATSHLSKLEENKRKLEKEITFYESNDNCPICEQGIDEEHKTSHVTKKQVKKKELVHAIGELGKIIQESTNRMEEIRVISESITGIQKTIGVIQTEIVSNQKYIKKLQSEIEDLRTESTGKKDTQSKIDDGEEQLNVLHAKKETLTEQGHYYDIASTLLKDQGVRQKIIKQYVPIMNNMINKYLASLEFFVGFELDESFEETIKSRFRDVFKYDNFSQGEKMRIDLALLFTWRTIARMKNSVNTNLLILDEVFDSSLDVAGTDDFLKLLNTLTEKTNTFIISHKGEALYDKFNNVIRMEKHKNFSRIAE